MASFVTPLRAHATSLPGPSPVQHGEQTSSPAHASVCPRAMPPAAFASVQSLSRRTERQLEQQYGPMWRYMSIISANGSPPGTRGEDAGHSAAPVAGPHTDARRQLLLERAREVGLIDPSAPDDTPQSLLPPTRSTVANADVTLDSSHAAEDPLIAFLEKNDDDAAILLAMWSSLRRSCLHASEISESLSLRVRYFFHSLIHRRAIAAAFELYDKLVYLGIHLKSNDLLLLLSNLPYEYSAAAQTKVEEWRQEGLDKDRERARNARRGAGIATEVRKTAERRNETERRAMQQQREREEAQKNRQPQGSAAGEAQAALAAGGTEASSQLELQVLAGQPEWVRRWVLYEASMGNLNLYGDEFAAGLLSAEAAAAAASDIIMDEPGSAAWEFIADAAAAATGGSSAPLSSAEMAHEASRLMEMTAVLRHLYLLQVTARVRDEWLSNARAGQPVLPPAGNCAKGPRVRKGERRIRYEARHAGRRAGKRTLRRAATASAAPPRFWKEGLTLLSNFLNRQQDSRIGLPASLLGVVHDIVRASHSWKAAYAFAKLLSSVPGALTDTDAVLFFRCACAADTSRGEAPSAARCSATSQLAPWERDTVVESFVDAELLPVVPTNTAAGYAIQAVWLAHLCRVKLSRPEVFLSMMARVEVPWKLGSDATGVGELMELGMAKAKLATSHLLVEVTRHGNNQKAQAVLVASIRSGAFSDERDEAQTGALAASLSASSGGQSESQVGGALLSAPLLDAFSLACSAVMNALSMAVLSAARGDAALIALQDFIESAVYGPFGLWAVFSQVYMDNRFVLSAKAVANAPERAETAALVCNTVLHVACELCQHGQGAGTRSQVRLLLQLASSALALVPSSAGGGGTGPHRLQSHEADALMRSVTSLCKPLIVFLDLERPDERTVFGVVANDTIDALALLAKLAIKTESLSSHPPARSRHGGGPPATSSLFERASPKTRRLLGKVCYAGTNALGRRVRAQLTRREVTDLDSLLRVHKRGPEAATGRMGASARVLPRFSRVGDATFADILTTRDAAYAAVLHSRAFHQKPGASADAALRQVIVDAAKRRVGALTVCKLLVEDIAAARGTVTAEFFAAVLTSMARGVQDSHRGPSAPPAPAGVFDDAVWVFWAAVDHTGPGRSADPAAGARVMAAHERDTLTTLLAPMLAVSNAAHRRDAGHQWRKAWAAKFTREERAAPEWQRTHVAALAALRDRNALRRATELYNYETSSNGAAHDPTVVPDLGSERQQLLLGTVALQHHSWEEALRSLYGALGTMEAREEAKSPYPRVAARVILAVLEKAPSNLSNTALRLRTIQGPEWDLQCAAHLLQLLVRARRWRLALEAARETLALPAVVTLLSAYCATTGTGTGVPRPSDEEGLQYAKLLVLAVQACAIGGQADEATGYYDAFKEVLRFHQGGAGGSSSSPVSVGDDRHDDDDDYDGLDALETALAKAQGRRAKAREVGQDGSSVPGSGGAVLEELEAMAPRARALFFRAMTKKMIAAPTRRSEKQLTTAPERVVR